MIELLILAQLTNPPGSCLGSNSQACQVQRYLEQAERRRREEELTQQQLQQLQRQQPSPQIQYNFPTLGR